MKRVFSLPLVAVFGLGLLRPAVAPPLLEAQGKPQEMKLKVGDMAPDFTLLAVIDGKPTPVSLHDYKGKKNVALAFFVFAFTGG